MLASQLHAHKSLPSFSENSSRGGAVPAPPVTVPSHFPRSAFTASSCAKRLPLTRVATAMRMTIWLTVRMAYTSRRVQLRRFASSPTSEPAQMGVFDAVAFALCPPADGSQRQLRGCDSLGAEGQRAHPRAHHSYHHISNELACPQPLGPPRRPDSRSSFSFREVGPRADTADTSRVGSGCPSRIRGERIPGA